MRATQGTIAAVLFGLSMLTLAGCPATPAGDTAASDAAPSGPSAEGEKYLLSAEPEGAKPVLKAKEAAADDEEVVVVGRIGGDVNPWVDGLAAFSIVDPSLPSCADNEGDHCPTPWDYCCEPSDKLNKAKAAVRVVNDEGQVVSSDAKSLLGLKELQTVVVRGKAKRDDAGNLTVLATEVFVRK